MAGAAGRFAGTGTVLANYLRDKEVGPGKERAMPRDDDIDTQVKADWEFTRRAEQLMIRLRTQGGKIGPSEGNEPEDNPDGSPDE
jgi:hypothetical protein